ncbi:hypothetical protein AVEN_222985-1 [Araneus ventricosus]|uniref:Uncharacterized protein n=1 Tax=Araneus ventricosus TaxID=182803 RepID=A0A4Y2V600_ARAVE|nr:hypothetical protein AVEN_222985-1 [Araneus ventricosus]
MAGNHLASYVIHTQPRFSPLLTKRPLSSLSPGGADVTYLITVHPRTRSIAKKSCRDLGDASAQMLHSPRMIFLLDGAGSCPLRI